MLIYSHKELLDSNNQVTTSCTGDESDKENARGKILYDFINVCMFADNTIKKSKDCNSIKVRIGVSGCRWHLGPHTRMVLKCWQYCISSTGSSNIGVCIVINQGVANHICGPNVY